MSENLITSVVTVVLAIVAVAFVAVLVSRNANTAGVLTASGSSASGFLGTALSPVTGSGVFGGLSGLTLTGGGAL